MHFVEGALCEILTSIDATLSMVLLCRYLPIVINEPTLVRIDEDVVLYRIISEYIIHSWSLPKNVVFVRIWIFSP